MTSRQSSARLLPGALVACLLAVPSAPLADAGQPGEGERETPRSERINPIDSDESQGVRRGPVPIRPPRIDALPEAGSGRLSIAFEGNRRWCTFPDDRLQKGPIKTPTGFKPRRSIHTFGYQFSIAAVDRAQADTTLLLYSSPVITTASLRQAGKLGRGKTPGRISSRNPVVVPDGEERRDPRDRETAATLVPYWDEGQRCASVAEQFDFDVEPGHYDLYIAFDIQIRSGIWVHRTYAYLTEVEVEEGNRTLVDGLMEIRGGGRRTLQLRSATIEPLAETGAARR